MSEARYPAWLDVAIDHGVFNEYAFLPGLENIEAVVEAAKPWPVKVILETSQLKDEEKVIACALAKAAGAAFVVIAYGALHRLAGLADRGAWDGALLALKTLKAGAYGITQWPGEEEDGAL